MSKGPFVLGVDLDGVVADFYAKIREVAAEWMAVPFESLTEEVTYGLPEWGLEAFGSYEELHLFAMRERGLFRTVTPISGAPAALRRLSASGVRIRIITHRLYIGNFHRETIAQTTEWLDHHGIPYWDLCFMKDKAAVGADLYVEDSPKNVLALQKAGHDTIIFENSTNRGIDGLRATSWSDVEFIVSERLRSWPRESDFP